MDPVFGVISVLKGTFYKLSEVRGQPSTRWEANTIALTSDCRSRSLRAPKSPGWVCFLMRACAYRLSSKTALREDVGKSSIVSFDEKSDNE
jgi:hypothetical protein